VALAVLLLGFGVRARAIECTDFPAGSQVNDWTAGHQTSLTLGYAPDGTLNAAWADYRAPLTPEVYYARSVDHGQTFGASVKVCPGVPLRVAGNPVLDSGPGGSITVVWAGEEVDDLDVYLVRSTNGGANFSAPIRINDLTLGDESLPGLCVTAGRITYVAWIEHPNDSALPEVRMSRALPGQPFGPSVLVNHGTAATSCECCNLDVAVIGEDEVYVAFMANLNYVRDIYVSRSTDSGATFADAVQVNDGHWFEPSCPISKPRLLVGPDDDLHIVWLDRHDFADQPSVYYARSSDGGQTFINRTRLNEEGAYVTGHPHVAVTGDDVVHTVWEDFNSTTGTVNIGYSASTDGGATFSPPCPLGSGSAFFQGMPAAVVEPGGKLTIGWQDDRTGTIDLYVANVQAVTSTSGPPPAQFVFRAAPNPFISGLAIELGNPSTILIHDVSGRVVREFAAMGPRLIWDGRNSGGQEVPAGIYFLRLPAGAASIKVARVR
jgi:hypothetical protein